MRSWSMLPVESAVRMVCARSVNLVEAFSKSDAVVSSFSFAVAIRLASEPALPCMSLPMELRAEALEASVPDMLEIFSESSSSWGLMVLLYSSESSLMLLFALSACSFAAAWLAFASSVELLMSSAAERILFASSAWAAAESRSWPTNTFRLAAWSGSVSSYCLESASTSLAIT